MALGGNKQQSFATLPLKPNAQKNKVRATEYLLIQQSSGMIRPWEFAGGAFRNPPLQTRSTRTDIKQIFIFVLKKQRTTSFIRSDTAIPTPPAYFRRMDRAD